MSEPSDAHSAEPAEVRAHEIVGVDSITELPIRRYAACPGCGSRNATPLRDGAAEFESLRHALLSFLEWARRFHGGDTSLDPEEYYIARDYAQVVLARTSTESPPQAAATEEPGL